MPRTALLAGLAATAAAALIPAAASACSLPPTGWSYSYIGPSDAGRAVTSLDGPIVLVGSIFGVADHRQIVDGLTVTVFDGEQPVPGVVVPLAVPGTLGWFPDAPLTADRTYRVEVDDADPDDSFVYLDPATVEVLALPPPEPADVWVSEATLVVEETPVFTGCADDDVCGGCFEQEQTGTEDRWTLSVDFQFMGGGFETSLPVAIRRGVGVDPDEALAVLERSPLHQFADVGTLAVDGPVEGWPGYEACLAIEIHQGANRLVREVFCEPVPGADPTATPDAAADDGGCSTGGPAGAPGGGPLALMLALGLLALRRRAGAIALAMLALTASGCTDDADPEDVEPCNQGACGETGRSMPPLTHNPTTPPITGGTLAITRAGVAVVADPARDRISLVDLDRAAVIGEVEAPGEPGRVVIDEARGRAWVALRRGGEVMTVSLDDLTTTHHPVCAAPRGLALDGDRLHVACAGGALWTLDPTGAVERTVAVAPDLRDVVVAGGLVHVSRFRAAELITLDADGAIVDRRAPATHDAFVSHRPTAPTVAWRTITTPDDRVLMLHQRSQLSTVVITEPGGYGGGGVFVEGCEEALVTTALTAFDPAPGAAPTDVGVARAMRLAVDVAAIGPDVVIAAPGNASDRALEDTVVRYNLATTERFRGCIVPNGRYDLDGEFTAVAVHDGAIVAQRREPPGLVVDRVTIPLPGAYVTDAGHDLFHKDAGGGIACASCHPEGGEDGHAWLFQDHGLRRTQELRGGVAGSAPFHWTGDMRDFRHLMDEVMTHRMGGPRVPRDYADALLGWIDAQPVEQVDPIEAGDVAAGAAIFADPMVGCAGCHRGPRLTDGERYDVGTGGYLETATLLGVGRRASVMHDGCAGGLADRFDPLCGGGELHGRTAHLSSDEITDLIAYLATL